MWVIAALYVDRTYPVWWHGVLHHCSHGWTVDVVYFPRTRQSALGTGMPAVVVFYHVTPEYLRLKEIGSVWRPDRNLGFRVPGLIFWFVYFKCHTLGTLCKWLAGHILPLGVWLCLPSVHFDLYTPVKPSLSDRSTRVFKPPPPVGAGGGYVFSGRPSVPLSMRASVRDSRGSFMFPRYLQYLLTDFRQTLVTGASWDTDALITFLGQKVKVQGHTIVAEAHSTRRYRRVHLFLVVVVLTDTDSLVHQ